MCWVQSMDLCNPQIDTVKKYVHALMYMYVHGDAISRLHTHLAQSRCDILSLFLQLTPLQKG